MSRTIDEEFGKIALNEQIRVIDRNLGYTSASAGFNGSPLSAFDKFLKLLSAPLPDIDPDYEDPWRNFLKGH